MKSQQTKQELAELHARFLKLATAMEQVPAVDDIPGELKVALSDTFERLRELKATDADGVSAKKDIVDYYDDHGIFDLAYQMQKSLVRDLIGLVGDASPPQV